jgi:hypothetical protein
MTATSHEDLIILMIITSLDFFGDKYFRYKLKGKSKQSF